MLLLRAPYNLWVTVNEDILFWKRFTGKGNPLFFLRLRGFQWNLCACLLKV